MKKLTFKENNEVTKTISLVDYVKDQCTPTHDNDRVVMLAKYDMKTGEGKVFKLSVDFTPITNITCFRQVVMAAYYVQIKEHNDNLIKTLTDKLNSESLTVDQNLKTSNERKLAEEYKEELEAIVEYFSTPVSDYNNQSPKKLAEESTIAQFVAGTISGSYPDVLDMNDTINKSKEYYEMLQREATQKELKDAYLEARQALEKICNNLSFEKTCFSDEHKNHANATLTKGTVLDIVTRWYRGRRINSKTGRVIRSVDSKGATMKKEIVLACLEKFHK